MTTKWYIVCKEDDSPFTVEAFEDGNTPAKAGYNYWLSHWYTTQQEAEVALDKILNEDLTETQ